ncbi:MAG TPA: potassium channel family protein [Candidatus Saccharimonadales bacterium]|nr:potassium channel family protein [Candidatus Saccharimonadales bacterium]
MLATDGDIDSKSLKLLKAERRRIQIQFKLLSLIALAVLTFGAIFYHFVEHLRWLDSFYFCTITLATVGYGDIVPKTDAGKFFTIFYVIIGIGIIGTFANLLIKNAQLRRQVRISSQKSRK